MVIFLDPLHVEHLKTCFNVSTFISYYSKVVPENAKFGPVVLCKHASLIQSLCSLFMIGSNLACCRPVKFQC